MGIVKNRSLAYFWGKVKALVTTVDNSIPTKAHTNIDSTPITEYPTSVGNYRSNGATISGFPSGCNKYGELHISGTDDYTHIYRDYNNRVWVGHTMNSVTNPTSWEKLAIDNDVESVTVSDENVNVTAQWQKLSRSVTMHITMKALKDITNSSVSIKLTGITPTLSKCATMLCPPATEDRSEIRFMELLSNTASFYGTYTSGSTYRASISYLGPM